MANFHDGCEFYKCYKTSNKCTFLFHRRYINDFELWRGEFASNLRSISSEPSINNWSEIRVFSLFLKDKMHEFERMRFEMILEHFTTDLMNWKVKIWRTGDSQISDKVEFYFNSPDKHVLFRRFAFENSNFLMRNSIFFQKIRNFWFWNFYFKWVDIIEKMFNFDDWPGVE